MDTRLLFAMWILAMIYFIYRIFNRKKQIQNVKVNSKIDEVINSEKYKPKGQFED